MFLKRSTRTLFRAYSFYRRPVLSSAIRHRCRTFDSVLLRRLLCYASEGNGDETFSSGDENEDLRFNKELQEEITKIYRYPASGHRLLLVQPRIKFGERYVSVKAATLKMDEAVALVQTLPAWAVVQKCIVSTRSTESNMIFGSGNLQMLKDVLMQNPGISAVFMGLDMLSALQNSKLEEHFGVQVFDRYQIVLRIFHDHARTREAKLQIALAEIPYLRVKLAAFSFNNYDHKTFEEIGHAGGAGETMMETRRWLLKKRELKLKQELEKLRKQREFLRQKEHRTQFPVVAVVGYTNCGKTTLIKCLTEDANLVPEDKLFATLDVTLHAGLLPSSQKVLFIDTVGFISDVPTTLIQCFRATLEDISVADVVIHVRDISHPDTEMQKQVVLETLHSLNLSDKLLNTMIEVGNKVDLVQDLQSVQHEDMLLISATEGNNLQQLVDAIEHQVIENTDQHILLFRVPNGGEAYQWLRREAAIRDSIADETDYNYLIVEVVICAAKLSKFTHQFGDLTITIDQIEAR